MINPSRIIITGGPGSGKSTLIEQLRERGFPCMKEAAREIINQHYKQNISPWGDMYAFIRLVYNKMYKELQQPVSSTTFCDRSIIDCIAYLKEAKLTIPAYLKELAPHRYYAKEVFILPPWQAIYRKEEARQQEYEKAVSLYKSIKSSYLELGFQLVEIPPLTVEERADLILSKLSFLQV